MSVLRYVIDAGILLLASVGLLGVAAFVGAAFLSRVEFELKDEWDQ